MFSHNEKVDMFLVFGESQNPIRAIKSYTQMSPEHVVPNLKILSRLKKKMLVRITWHFLLVKGRK